METMFSGSVVGIYIAPEAGAPMESRSEVEALANKGLDGDRYARAEGKFSGHKRPDQQRAVTLIEREALLAIFTEYGIELGEELTRRNIVVEGVALNHLVGREFMVGEVRMLGVGLAEPCAYLEEISGVKARQPLIHRGGLRAEVLTSGRIVVADKVTVV